MQNSFIFNIYNDDGNEILEIGNYYFWNNDYSVRLVNAISFLIFRFIVNYNLSDLELFLQIAGFNSMKIKDIPCSVINPEIINLSTSRDINKGPFKGYTNSKYVIAYIKSEFGEDIITKYMNVKKMCLYHKAQLLKKLCNNESTDFSK